MDHFQYREGVLHAEGINIENIAEDVGTPFYCYSRATLERHYHVLQDALSQTEHQICYAVKANSNIAVLKVLAQLGSGADVVSEGELRRAISAGIDAQKIVFSGVGKTKAEMAYALDQHILQFNVESEPELDALQEVAASKNMRAPIAIRINPDVDAQTHAKISTGKKENKFGVSLDHARALYQKAADYSHIQVQGVSMHIGSQLTSLDPFKSAYQVAKDFVNLLREEGHEISILDVGGGLGVPYIKADKPPPLPSDYGLMTAEVLKDCGCKLIVEPGRLLVGNAGILVSDVIYVKETGTKRFLIVDAAMNDLLRPAMYDAFHELCSVKEPANDETLDYDIVGPVCETGDTFARDVALPKLQAGELIAFRTTGAYGATMSNSYNTRPLVAEVLVDQDRFAVIRPRQSYEALLGQDAVPEWL